MASLRKPSTCAVCRHQDRARIEALRIGGASLDSLAAKFAIHRDALWRHMRNHVSADAKGAILVGEATLERLREKALEEKGSVLEHLQIARSMTLAAMVASAEAASWTTFSMLAGRYVETNREVARITGEIEKLPGINITNNFLAIMNDPRMIELQAGLLAVARSHPGARGDIISLLRNLDSRPPQTNQNGAQPLLIEAEAINQ
jgi:hypothetical protein